MYRELIEQAYDSLMEVSWNKKHGITRNDLLWYIAGYRKGELTDLCQLLEELREFEDEFYTGEIRECYYGVIR